MKPIFLLFAVLLASSGVKAQQGSYEIDDRLQKCLNATQNQTTAGMTDCTNRAYEEWDGELNRYYKLILNKLSAEGREKMKSAQIAWTAYRDKEFALSNAVYDMKQGSMWLPIRAQRRVDIVKARALELKDYYETLMQ